MPKIFEIFGYPISDQSNEANEARKNAYCSFTNRDCDGGGNRYLSDITLKNHPPLAAMFPHREKIRSGVCSIQPTVGKQPWIVCPRRLLALNRTGGAVNSYQGDAEKTLLSLLGYASGTKLGVWSEVKIAYADEVDRFKKTFDYTFDYIFVPLGRITKDEAEKASQKEWKILRRYLELSGYTISQRDGTYWVEDFPSGTPSIIEIMTSSTSGGNKVKRTTIPAAFEDALLGKDHKAPGINYRQVWARMVSQLIVKSEVALSWGGKTVWIVQDVLLDYISASTGLNLNKFVSKHTNDVNMLSLSYTRAQLDRSGVIELKVADFYAGPISSSTDATSTPSFQDIVRSPLTPPASRLIFSLIKNKPINYMQVG